MSLGQYVRAARQARRLTLQELADAITATRKTSATAAWLSLLENDKINPRKVGADKLQALAIVLEVSIDDLYAAELSTPDAPDALPALLAEAGRLGVPRYILEDTQRRADTLPADLRAALVEEFDKVVSRYRPHVRQPEAHQQPAIQQMSVGAVSAIAYPGTPPPARGRMIQEPPGRYRPGHNTG